MCVHIKIQLINNEFSLFICSVVGFSRPEAYEGAYEYEYPALLSYTETKTMLLWVAYETSWCPPIMYTRMQESKRCIAHLFLQIPQIFIEYIL